MRKQTICLNMIVKNESEVISECLNAISYLIDTYVIVDTGSTDNTPELIKKIFDEKNIPGTVIIHDFSTCTCHGSEYKKSKYFNFADNRNYALDACYKKADYILIMDADDTVEGNLKFPPKLVADSYNLTVRTDNNIYFKPLLIRNDKKIKWRWYAGLHEFLDGKTQQVMRLIGDYAVVSRRLGARNKDPMKYYNDAMYLEELMAETKNDPALLIRYKYYYAQSWFDAKEYEKSIKVYQEVIDESDDPDRKYSCHFMLGRCHILKESDATTIESVYVDCGEKYSNRAEPWFQLLAYFNIKKDFKKAYDYGIKGLGIPMPTETVFNIDKMVYDYRLLDELVFAASQIGKYKQALKWSQKLLKEKKYPKDSQQTIVSNVLALNDIIEKQSKLKGKCEHDETKPSLCFYLGPSPLIDEEVFGSELAVHYLAKALSLIYNIYVSGDECTAEIPGDGFMYVPACSLANKTFDVVIVSRYIKYFIEFDVVKVCPSGRTYMWLHDIDIHPYYSNAHIPDKAKALAHNIDHLVKGYITLSPWHKKRFVDTYGVIESKVHVIGNGIPDTHFTKEVTKDRGSFIWVSDPSRGLAELIQNFPRILQVIPNAHLEVFRKVPKEIKELAKDMPFINFRGYHSNDMIIKAFAIAEYWLYPTKWEETFCISALEAMSMGCFCISSDLAALTTTIGDHGILIKSQPIYSEEYWYEITSAITKLEKSQDTRLSMIEDAANYARYNTWTNKAKEWHTLLSD